MGTEALFFCTFIVFHFCTTNGILHHFWNSTNELSNGIPKTTSFKHVSLTCFRLPLVGQMNNPTPSSLLHINQKIVKQQKKKSGDRPVLYSNWETWILTCQSLCLSLLTLANMSLEGEFQGAKYYKIKYFFPYTLLNLWT